MIRKYEHLKAEIVANVSSCLFNSNQGPHFAAVQDIRLLVKPSNLNVVAESGGSHSLLAMGSWALNDKIIEMQNKMGTAEFNRAAYEALFTGYFPDPGDGLLPNGSRPAFSLATTQIGAGEAREVRKLRS